MPSKRRLKKNTKQPNEPNPSADPSLQHESIPPSVLGTKSQQKKKKICKQLNKKWRYYVDKHFPDARQRVHFIPPCHCYKVPYIKATVNGQTVYQRHDFSANGQQGKDPNKPSCQESDLRDDLAHCCFLKYLRALSEENHEGMVIISHLEYKDYLGKCPGDAILAEAYSAFPRLVQAQDKCTKGEMDVIILHPSLGIIVTEIKSVGAFRNTDIISALKRKLKDAVKQLKKALNALNNVVENDPVTSLRHVPITPTLVLPYVRRDELVKALQEDSDIFRDLSDCFNCDTISEVADRCLCGGEMADSSLEGNKSTTENTTAEATMFTRFHCTLASWRRTLHEAFSKTMKDLPQDEELERPQKESMELVKTWWTKAVVDVNKNKTFPAHCYEQLLARFCGPATLVYVNVPTMGNHRQPVKTRGEAVAHTGLVMTSLVLVREQVDLLKEEDDHCPCVYLSGPPGSGKTLCLVLKAVQWLKEGYDVHVISLGPEGVAASMLIEKQIQIMSGAQAAGGVHRTPFHFRSIEDVKTAVENLVHAAEARAVRVVVDEITPIKSALFNEFFKRLKRRVSKLHVWVASIQTPRNCPRGFRHEVMTFPLRCTPVVQREVSRSEHIGDSTVDSIITPSYR